MNRLKLSVKLTLFVYASFIFIGSANADIVQTGEVRINDLGETLTIEFRDPLIIQGTKYFPM